MANDILNLLTNNIFPSSKTVPASTVSTIKQGHISDEDLNLLRRIGITTNELSSLVGDALEVNYERFGLYKEIDNALMHPLVAAAAELYADVAVTYSSLQGSTVWPTGDSKYVSEIENLFERINLEERIFDWAWTTASYGDLIAEVNAEPGLGVIAVNDNQHPLDISRVDRDGILLGYFPTPLGNSLDKEAKLLPPWTYIHMNLLGAKRKRSLYGDSSQANDYRTTYIISKDSRRLTSKYGTSVLINALPIYKRLRMCEDSLMMARITRGVLRYLYKVGVTGDNAEAVLAMIDQYKSVLKTARALDTTAGAGSGYFQSRFDPLSSLADILVPVWGDVGNLSVEEIGGSPDLKWIVDIEEMRNQLACALRVPLQLLGGYMSEASGPLGSTAVEKLDIRFARNCRRLQRALLSGLTRLCQIHFAYMGMSPDVSLFELHMPETSTAEEEELKEALDKGVDVISKVMEMLESVDENIDKVEVFTYLNEKILKLNDFDLSAFMKIKKLSVESINRLSDSELNKLVSECKEFIHGRKPAKNRFAGDLRAALPTAEGIKKYNSLKENSSQSVLNEVWNNQFGDCTVKVSK